MVSYRHLEYILYQLTIDCFLKSAENDKNKNISMYNVQDVVVASRVATMRASLSGCFSYGKTLYTQTSL